MLSECCVRNSLLAYLCIWPAGAITLPQLYQNCAKTSLTSPNLNSTVPSQLRALACMLMRQPGLYRSCVFPRLPPCLKRHDQQPAVIVHRPPFPTCFLMHACCYSENPAADNQFHDKRSSLCRNVNCDHTEAVKTSKRACFSHSNLKSREDPTGHIAPRMRAGSSASADIRVEGF